MDISNRLTGQEGGENVRSQGEDAQGSRDLNVIWWNAKANQSKSCRQCVEGHFEEIAYAEGRFHRERGGILRYRRCPRVAVFPRHRRHNKEIILRDKRK